MIGKRKTVEQRDSWKAVRRLVDYGDGTEFRWLRRYDSHRPRRGDEHDCFGREQIDRVGPLSRTAWTWALDDDERAELERLRKEVVDVEDLVRQPGVIAERVRHDRLRPCVERRARHAASEPS